MGGSLNSVRREAYPMRKDREPASTLRTIESAIIPAAMRVHTTTLSAGISRTVEFEKRGLAQFAINVGTKCSHGCPRGI